MSFVLLDSSKVLTKTDSSDLIVTNLTFQNNLENLIQRFVKHKLSEKYNFDDQTLYVLNSNHSNTKDYQTYNVCNFFSSKIIFDQNNISFRSPPQSV
jgi:hypothetical protein